VPSPSRCGQRDTTLPAGNESTKQIPKILMLKKILFGIIGALLALLLLVLAVFLGTNLLGFQIVAVLELCLNMIAGFLLSKKFAKNEMVKNLSLGALYGSFAYLALIFLAKTVAFSLLGSILN
jgi:hypothetical protein